MPNQTLTIDVAVTPKGNSFNDGVAFAYSAPNAPAGTVTGNGDINLNRLGRGNCDLQLALTTPQIVWSEPPYQGTFAMSFYGGANGAKDALWIADNAEPSGPYQGSEFTGWSLGPGYLTLNVTDDNNDAKSYRYALAIYAKTDPGNNTGVVLRDDPSLLNTQTK